MTNRLKSATSPYLLQHADNPVDWWPWSDAAFAEARRRDVPVLLSVGYAACHWCHVMAHESFEDHATAAIVNDSVVAIKVDREERPDIDAVYMAATQAMTGQGGWPMTVFMTPDGEPFFCGTYFPRVQFAGLVRRVAEIWKNEKAVIQGESTRISAVLAESASAVSRLGEGAGELNLAEVTATAVAGLAAGFDQEHGGFGRAPKFPPSMALEFLLRYHERTAAAAALEMAAATCAAMARGGLYDQLGGGFARYSVDAAWTVPHFEKMLYDNALLARVYTHLWRRGGSPLARQVAEETCDFMMRELRTPEGGLSASLDAGSDGHEGTYYVWTPAQLREVLGEQDGTFAAQAFGVTADGTFERGASVLQRRTDAAPQERLDRIRGVLLTAREGRTRPARDDKVVAAWNGMAIGALAEAGVLFDRPDLLAAARDAAELLATVHLSGQSRIARTSRHGLAGPSAGLLEDYACVASGFLALYGVTGAVRWASAAGSLLDTVLSSFGDGSGGFYDTAADGERLLFRPADPADGATPSGAFAAADALLSYGALTGEARYTDAAVAALRVLPSIAARYPRAGGLGLSVAEAMLAGPAEIAIVGPEDDPRTGDLLRAALHLAPPGAVFARGPGAGATGPGPADSSPVPLLTGRDVVSGAPAAYVCRNFTCQAPVTTPSALRDALRP